MKNNPQRLAERTSLLLHLAITCELFQYIQGIRETLAGKSLDAFHKKIAICVMVGSSS